MFRVTLACSGVPTENAHSVAADVAEEFTHRTWHRNVSCTWDGQRLWLSAENEFDSDGKALLDEFSDALAAATNMDDGELKVVSVIRV